VAVIGEKDADWGEVVVAFVKCEEGASVTAEELDAFCVERIARFKRPKRYRFLPDLPKNAYGKILKKELREQASADSP
jgi:long-chain acyl-CoA synthetase